MANFKYRLKEIVKPKDVDPELLDRIEKRYGKINPEYDFFSDDLSSYYKTLSVDPDTGSIDHQTIKLASFGDSLKELSQAVRSLDDLSKTTDGKLDPKLAVIAQDVRDVFNKFRTHIRKEYPEQYVQIKNLLDEVSSLGSTSMFTSGGEGENHTGPSPKGSTYGAYKQAGYKKVNEGPGATMGPGPKAGPKGVTKNKYVTDFKYKLVNQKALNKAAKGIEVKQLWEETDVESYLQDASINKSSNKKWVGSRLLAFDKIERQLNELIPLLQQSKHETMDYYKQNPDSFNVVYGTDLAQEYLNDLIELFKK